MRTRQKTKRHRLGKRTRLTPERSYDVWGVAYWSPDLIDFDGLIPAREWGRWRFGLRSSSRRSPSPAHDSQERACRTCHVAWRGRLSQRWERRGMRWALLSLVLGLAPASAFAMCTCECIDGAVQALCDSSDEVAPLCPARVCPAAPQ